jgi:hypothetical protein
MILLINLYSSKRAGNGNGKHIVHVHYNSKLNPNHLKENPNQTA